LTIVKKESEHDVPPLLGWLFVALVVVGIVRGIVGPRELHGRFDAGYSLAFGLECLALAATGRRFQWAKTGGRPMRLWIARAFFLAFGVFSFWMAYDVMPR
jgi:hypothetical protein